MAAFPDSDLMQQRRSTNVEDYRTGPAMELINRLTAIPRQSLDALINHPFMKTEDVMAQRYNDYLRANPPDYGSPLAFEAGVGNVSESGKLPVSFHPEGMIEPEQSRISKILRAIFTGAM